MIFNEIYSVYYNTVAKIISAIIDSGASEKQLNEIVYKNAFGESVITILPALKSGKWQLVASDLTTPLKHKPTMPLTDIQKRWLKSISLDSRIRLFDINLDFLNDVEPLFTDDDYYIYDKYADGDDYTDEGYITRFRTILSAIKASCQLKVKHTNRRGNTVTSNVYPLRLEYSEKDDKFRLVTKGTRFVYTINLARITECRIPEKIYGTDFENLEKQYGTFTLKINNQRNALERCMLHFAHFEKRAEKTDDGNYLAHIYYDKSDETELVIRVLGFGPLIEVVEPSRFRELIIERLKKQKDCEL